MLRSEKRFVLSYNLAVHTHMYSCVLECDFPGPKLLGVWRLYLLYTPRCIYGDRVKKVKKYTVLINWFEGIEKHQAPVIRFG